ncbi:MAG: type II toxin-antitoxin system VapC family toxin [Propionibacteriaceae bacterium]|nr:type II toxin-antitoxin system VapC family toxin [Propionibacteriaceae bacterium]
MKPAYLLDTNVLVALLRGKAPHLRDKLAAHAGKIAVSTVSVMELQYGANLSDNPVGSRRRVSELLSLVQVLPFDEAAAKHTGFIRAALKQAGTPICPFDSQIAGHARSRSLTVVTNNTREFARVEGLAVTDWQADSPPVA